MGPFLDIPLDKLNGIVDQYVVVLFCFKLDLIDSSVLPFCFGTLRHLPSLVVRQHVGDILISTVESFLFFVLLRFGIILCCVLHPISAHFLLLLFCIFMSKCQYFFLQMTHLQFLDGQLLIVEYLFLVLQDGLLLVEDVFLPLVHVLHP